MATFFYLVTNRQAPLYYVSICKNQCKFECSTDECCVVHSAGTRNVFERGHWEDQVHGGGNNKIYRKWQQNLHFFSGGGGGGGGKHLREEPSTGWHPQYLISCYFWWYIRIHIGTSINYNLFLGLTIPAYLMLMKLYNSDEETNLNLTCRFWHSSSLAAWHLRLISVSWQCFLYITLSCCWWLLHKSGRTESSFRLLARVWFWTIP